MSEREGPIKGIDLSLDNIELNEFKQKNGKSLQQENKFMRKQNQILRKELEKISSRLDGEIKKRIDESKKKQSSRGEQISQMQLQNAYKKCQIYKKEAEQYKKKLQFLSDDRVEDFERRITSYAKDNFELKEEIKQLKKINKLQEKGLTELGVEGYSTIVTENQKLKEEVRILKKQVDNIRRTMEKNKTHSSMTEERANESVQERRASSKRTSHNQKLQERLKKKIKTQQNQSNEESEDLTDLLQQKVQKDYHKLKSLAQQKEKLREIVDNLKVQLSEKEKENTLLKQKIAVLRKNNQILQSQVLASRSESDMAESKQEKEEKENLVKLHKDPRKKPFRTTKESSKQKRVWKQEIADSDQKDVPSELSKNSNYPRKEERGSVMANSVKWSHQHLSSKIKQLQILLHEQGHIKDIHVRYEKGEPKKYDHSTPQNKYSVFSCTEDEFVKHIEGAFCEGYLQYLTVTSNHRRVQKYGNYKQFQQNEEAQYFQFEVGEKEYPGALFGESDESGIRKLGCFIHKQN